MALEFRIDDSVCLRTLSPDDAGDLFALTDRNRDHLRRWLPWVDETVTQHDSLEFISGSIARLQRNEGFDAGIFVDDELAGMIAFISIDWRNRATAIGYWLSEHVQGRGIMTRAVSAVIAYGFEVLELNRIEIRCAVGNLRSMAIPWRLGFTDEGVRREAELLNGRWLDHHVFSLLRREYGGSGPR